VNEPDDAEIDLGMLAGSLGSLLDASESTGAGWTAADYGSLLEHQLAARLSDDLSRFFTDVPAAIAGIENHTFRELLGTPCPSLPALKMVRHFAKQLITGNDGTYPDEVARVLYFASIAAAQVHGGERITKLEPVQLREGYAWARYQPWLTVDLRALFDKALVA